jgi:hypothetical protein
MNGVTVPNIDSAAKTHFAEATLQSATPRLTFSRTHQ